MNSFQVEVLTTANQLDKYEAEWRRFLEHVPGHSLYHTPDYWLSSLSSLSSDQAAHFVIILRSFKDKPQQIVAVAPFVLQTNKFMLKLGLVKFVGIQLERLSCTGNSIAIHESEDFESITDIVLRRLLHDGINLISFDCLPVDKPLYTMLIAEDQKLLKNFKFQINDRQPLRGLRFESDFDHYLAGMSKKTRYNLKRNIKQFSKKTGNDPELIKVESESDVEMFLKDMDAIYKNTWQARTFGYKSRLNQGSTAHHLGLARAGMLRSYLLKSGDQAVAFIRGYQYGKVYYFEEIGYDMEWRELQPGSVLNFLAIEDMFKFNPPGTLDFGFGENDYKKILGNMETTAVIGSLVVKRSKAAVVLGIQSFLNWLYTKIHHGISAIGLDKTIRSLLKRR